MEKQKVILDVDTGTDDAIAIMTALASPELDVLGVCTVNGNRSVDNTTENTLRLKEYLGSDVRVYKGCSLPMVSSLTDGRRPNMPITSLTDSNNIHGDYLELPPSKEAKAENEHAVFFLIDTLMASDGDIILIPVGPLTNIAMAMRIEPEICKKIKRIVIMGGGYKEVNITPAAEFNFWVDPEAAKIVIDSGCDILIVPLDATHTGVMSLSDADEMEKMNTKASIYTASVIRKRQSGYKVWQPMADIDTVPIHDALAVCAVLDETVLEDVREVYADMDITNGVTDGMSVFDFDHRYKDRKANVKVALSANRKKFASMIKERLGNFY